jgi:uncharacterized membrane protein YhfC
MEISPLLFMAGAGMLLVGAAPIAYWKIKKKVANRFFLLGAAFWAVAIAIKLAMDFSVTGPVKSTLNLFPYTFFLVLWALYFGLRTGLFECGIPYLLAGRAGLSKVSFNEAMAFGLGFGCTEAIVLGAVSLLNMSVLILNPQLLAQLSPSQAEALRVQSENALMVSAAAILERAAALLIHALACLLVFAAIAQKKLAFLLEAIVLKAVLDGAVVLVGMAELDIMGKLALVEIPVLLLGFASAFGISKISEMGVIGPRK